MVKIAISITGRQNKGFTYIGLLAAVAVLAIVAERAVLLESTWMKREMEQELLFRGTAYREAIRSYYHARSPAEYPRHLDDLLKDPRFLHRRHLRQHYSDPTGAQWRILRDESGGIIGIASGSKAEPLQQGNFEQSFSMFTDARTYGDWRFEYLAQGVVSQR